MSLQTSIDQEQMTINTKKTTEIKIIMMVKKSIEKSTRQLSEKGIVAGGISLMEEWDV